jgi:hypothetical protein
MKLGFVVDGQAEYLSLRHLFSQLENATGNVFLRTVRADLQPYAPYGAMARSCRARLLELEGRGADCVVILLDRERRVECPSDLATGLRQDAQRYTATRVEVVIKDWCFENWLIADLNALSSQRGRFAVPRACRKCVEPNKADSADSQKLIKGMARDTYEKVLDSERILARMDILRAAEHSRSFRRFLRVVGHPHYASQSLEPSTGDT